MIRRLIFTVLITAMALLSASCENNNLGQIYTITYYALDTSSGSVPEAQIKEYDVDITLAYNTGNLSRESSALIGWSTAYNGEGTLYKLGEIYSSNADLSLYALWVPGSRITYDANSATGGTAPFIQSKPEGIDLILSGNTGSLTKTAFGFCGWNTEADGSGIKYEVGTTYTVDADLTLYAMWFDVSWAKSVDGTGLNTSWFWGSATDNSGNVWAAGDQFSFYDYSYSGATAIGINNGGINAVLVKYNSEGIGLWAVTPEQESPDADSTFKSVATDDEGNSYAAGYISGAGTFTFKTGVSDSAAAPDWSGLSAVLVKYDPDGNAKWARTVTGGGADSTFLSVAVYGGYVYAAGYQKGGSLFDYGVPEPDLGTSGTSGNKNAVLVQYDTDGNCNWANSTTAGNFETNFDDIAIDSGGNIYAVGYKFGGSGDTSEFGNSITVNGIFTSNNALIVKYEPSAGIPQWAACPTSGIQETHFKSITIDDSDSIYVAGDQHGSAPYEYTSAEATATGPFSGTNAVLVKYDSSGNPKWAKTPESGSAASFFLQVATDGINLWVSGPQAGTDSFSYGNSVTITGLNGGDNSIILKYNAEGAAIWGKAAIEAADQSNFNSVTVNSLNVFTVGYQLTGGDFNYGINPSGADVTAAGGNTSGENAVIIKYVK